MSTRSGATVWPPEPSLVKAHDYAVASGRRLQIEGAKPIEETSRTEFEFSRTIRPELVDLPQLHFHRRVMNAQTFGGHWLQDDADMPNFAWQQVVHMDALRRSHMLCDLVAAPQGLIEDGIFLGRFLASASR